MTWLEFFEAIEPAEVTAAVDSDDDLWQSLGDFYLLTEFA